MSVVVATFEIEKATKNTFRYRETDDSEALGAIGTIYISKQTAMLVLGQDGQHPERIVVTVEVDTR